MLDTMGPTVSVYIYFYMLYTSLLLAKSNWFTSNIGKLSYTSWYDDGDDDNSNDDKNGDDDDDSDMMVMMLVMMLKMIIMALTELKY